MSCNGCRVLRKGCGESCVLRPCLMWIDTADAQANATVFLAKFFGRAGLMSFISAVPINQRPALFRSLLYEACGRTVNPVHGAVGLLWTGDWHLCQTAVETVLRGGALRQLEDVPPPEVGKEFGSGSKFDDVERLQPCDLDLSLKWSPILAESKAESRPSMESEGSAAIGSV